MLISVGTEVVKLGPVEACVQYLINPLLHFGGVCDRMFPFWFLLWHWLPTRLSSPRASRARRRHGSRLSVRSSHWSAGWRYPLSPVYAARRSRLPWRGSWLLLA